MREPGGIAPVIGTPRRRKSEQVRVIDRDDDAECDRPPREKPVAEHDEQMRGADGQHEALIRPSWPTSVQALDEIVTAAGDAEQAGS